MPITHSLFKYPEICYRPDPEYDFSDDLFTGDAANRSAAGIHRGGPVIAHAEVSIVRYLVGQINVTIPQGFFCQIRLIQQIAVHIHISVSVNIHPLTRTGDTAFDQNLVAHVKGYQIAQFTIRPFDREHNIPLIQRWRHGSPVDLQHRHPDGGDQYGYSRNDHKGIDSASQDPPISLFVFLSVKLRFELFQGWKLAGRICCVLH